MQEVQTLDPQKIDFDPYRLQAQVYDALHTALRDYNAEAHEVMQLIAKYGNGGKTLLDVACGTGLHLQHFRPSYRVVGLDRSSAMLDRAAMRLQHVELAQRDMRNFDLDGRRFSAVTCLCSSIGHMQSLEDLSDAIECMAKHLEPGGVLVLEPWYTPYTWLDRQQPAVVWSGDGSVVRVTLASYVKKDERTEVEHALLQMHHHMGHPLETGYFISQFLTSLFTDEQYEEAIERAGLKLVYESAGINASSHPVYIGINPR
ncbi:class I SAM-dependent methyltransferase [Patescibacteria group bacterium]|nr:MAG: class I SAM-dependent methyltransferase [Patescibacteria group bacterium]